MSWGEVEKYIEEGGTGRMVLELVKKLRDNEEMRRRLRDEILLYSGAIADSTVVIDRNTLDDFLSGKLPMPTRLQVLSAVCQDEKLWQQLEQILEMKEAAEKFDEEPEDTPTPDELKEEAARYEAYDAKVPLISIATVHDRWRIEEEHPLYHYEIQPRAAARLGNTVAGLKLVDEATISHAGVRCAIALSAREKKFELQIENCPLQEERFQNAEILLRGKAHSLRPSSREYLPKLSRIVFEDVDPQQRYVLEIDPALFTG